MAVPKQKTSKSKKGTRRSHQSIPIPSLHWDKDQQEYTISHHISPARYYKNKKVHTSY